MKKVFYAITLLLLIGFSVSATAAYYFYTQNQKSQYLLQNPTEAAKEEVRVLFSKVNKLLELPAKEEPTIATVISKDRLKDQAFFAKSDNGDKVLIYTQARKAILYRPSTNKIIEVAPIILGPEASASESGQVAGQKTVTPSSVPQPTPIVEEVLPQPSPSSL